jgi:hypothetical protein
MDSNIKQIAEEFMTENKDMMQNLADGPKDVTNDEPVFIAQGNVESPTTEVTTQVTSIAQEEAKTGQKVKMPTPEELVQRASSSFIASRRQLGNIFKDLSAKAKTRVLLSILDLPTDGIPVILKDDKEKYCFGLGQRMINDRFTITYFHMAEEQKKIAAQKQQEEVDKKTEANKQAVLDAIQGLKTNIEESKGE